MTQTPPLPEEPSDYLGSPPARARPWQWRKWTILSIYWLLQAAAWFFLYPLLMSAVSQHWVEFSDAYRSDSVRWMGCIVLGVSLLQALFILPVRKPALMSSGGLSVKASLAVAALCSAVLCMAILFTAYDMLVLADMRPEFSSDAVFFSSLIVCVLVLWAVWTPLLFAFCKTGPRETVLARVASIIFTGTIIEVVAIIPVQAMMRRKDDCYCGQGTFWSLVSACSVGIFMLGPAIFLPLLSRRRRRYYAGRCGVCMYDMSGCIDAPQCPECGAGWRSPTSTPTPPSPPSPT